MSLIIMMMMAKLFGEKKSFKEGLKIVPFASFAGPKLNYSLQYLYLPGTTAFILIPIITVFMHKMSKEMLKKRGELY